MYNQTNMYGGKFFISVEKYCQTHKLNELNKQKLFIKSNKSNEENILEIYSEDLLLFKGYYYIGGIYDTVTFMWYWPYILDYMDQSLCISKNIIYDLYKYAKKNSQYINQRDMEDITFRTTNNSFYMNSINNITPLFKLLIYFTESIDYFFIYYDDNKVMRIYNGENNIRNIYLIIIKKILRIL